jgi:riboflavin synthase
MFTGIVESEGVLVSKIIEKENIDFTFSCPFTSELKIDQSLAHNGVCLTVVKIDDDKQEYTVTAIKETLIKSNLGELKEGDVVNLERCMKLGDRLDGHLVQGHVDQTARCTQVKENKGSWDFEFQYDPKFGNLTVSKGSICINGVSLTVVNSGANSFSVCIIPYTYAHTNFRLFKLGSKVNLEFDIIGKYIVKQQQIKEA